MLKFILLVLANFLYFLLLAVFKNRLFGWVVGGTLFAAALAWFIIGFKKQKRLVKILSVAGLALLMGLNGLISAPKVQRVSAGNGDKNGYTEVYTVAEGQLQGINNSKGDVEIFAGIPYAKPPVGELRWKEPQKAEKWEGIRKCDTYAPMAMQKKGNPIYDFGASIIGYNEIPIDFSKTYIEAMSEDCLYLNIWKPKNIKEGDKVPVLFYIHGGSLNSGQSYYEAYNGENYASQGIIFVSISYRLGVFGYLADPELAAESANGTTGNYGLLDQIAALKWVNDNIEKFGGDPGNITIAGESAGASSVSAICVSPLAKGLFRRAIAESSGLTAKVPYHTFRTVKRAQDVASDIKKEFSCDSIEDLRKIPAEKLVNTKYQNNEMTVDGYAIVEQPYLTYQAGNNNEEAILGGFNGNEAYVFMMFDDMPKKESYVEFLAKVLGSQADAMAELLPAADNAEAKKNFLDMVSMAWFGYSHYTWSELMAANNRPTYLYYFTKQNKSLGDWHAGELPYFYGNLKHNKNYNETDFALSATIQGYILNYVKTGDPNGPGLPRWETYNSDPSKLLHMDTEVGMEVNKYNEVFKIFDAYMEEKNKQK